MVSKDKYLFSIIKEKRMNKFDKKTDIIIVAEKKKNVYDSTNYFSNYDLIVSELKNNNHKNIQLVGFTNELIDIILPYLIKVKFLWLFKSKDIEDYIFIEQLKNIEYIDIYWNRKAIKLWDLKQNPNLKKLSIVDSNKLINFSGLKGSTLEELIILGCNYCSSFTPKLAVDDFSVFSSLNQLKSLTLALQEKASPSNDLIELSKIKTLEELYLDNGYTFEQFAWLKSKLPLVKTLEAYEVLDYDDVDKYKIIGKKMPIIRKLDRALEYKKQYDELVEKYKHETNPPSK